MAAATSLIAREGWPFIAVVAMAAFWVQYQSAAPLAAAPLWALTAAFVFLFRDPARQVPSSPLAVVSPVDAHVVTVETIHDRFLDREAVRICLQMRRTGSYGVRSPTEGRVMRQWFSAASSLRRPVGEEDNQGLWMRTDEGDDVVIAISPGIIPRALRCYVRTGQRVGQGQRCGFIYFGAHVEVLLPVHTRIRVQPGERVYAGSDVLATLVHKTAVAGLMA